jgi:hypothetical protein
MKVYHAQYVAIGFALVVLIGAIVPLDMDGRPGIEFALGMLITPIITFAPIIGIVGVIGGIVLPFVLIFLIIWLLTKN